MAPLRSDREWIYWGERDPLYGVVTRPGREAGGPNPWTAEEFLETGRRYFRDVLLHWTRYGAGKTHCVEIGCGAGRITYQLLDQFAEVTALDVSPAQIERAKTLLGDRAARTRFELVSEPQIPLQDASADGVFSCEVFQHLDSEDAIARYIREACRVLASGGTMCVQIPVLGLRPWTPRGSRGHNAVLRLLRWAGRRHMMMYRQYRAERVLEIMQRAGFADVEMQVFHAEEQDGFHPYFMGRKS
jgi:ubiquinone/menaquinone biosynthesis C-methylase UbiE